jgi:hypothetical protein
MYGRGLVHMLLRAKKLAFLGLLLAVTVILVILSGILDFNTLFLLAAASFCVGIAIRETSLILGVGFFIASILLSLMLAPNKLYCLTFAAMGLYLIITEFSWSRLIKITQGIKRETIFWIIKLIVFNIIYIPILIVSPKLIYQGEIDLKSGLILILLAGGQVAIVIYDKAYNYFQKAIWGKFRRHFL